MSSSIAARDAIIRSGAPIPPPAPCPSMSIAVAPGASCTCARARPCGVSISTGTPLRLQPPSVALGRPPASPPWLRRGQPGLRLRYFARRHALGRLLVQQCGLGGGTAPLRAGEHVDDHAPLWAEPHLDPVPRPHLLRGLHALAVHLHVPATHGLDRERARLHEPRGPEPLVDPLPVAVHPAELDTAGAASDAGRRQHPPEEERPHNGRLRLRDRRCRPGPPRAPPPPRPGSPCGRAAARGGGRPRGGGKPPTPR